MSVIIRVIYDGTTYDLDIQEDVPLRLDVSAIENTEIGQTFGVGSQTFNLPGTKNNNRFFKHAYNVGGEDIPAFYNTIDGRILSKGETLLKGQFQLLEVVKDEVGYVVYKCQMADETVQFKDAIQNKLITNADWGEYEHTLNVANITGSWQNQLLDGKVYYPLANYGYDDPESQGNYPEFAFSGTGFNGNYFNVKNQPIQPAQFLPSVRAKDTLEVICAQAGFSASGDFINSGYFSNLFLLPKAKEGIGIVISGSEDATGYATNNYNQSVAPNAGGVGFTTQDLLAANNIVTDPQNKFFNSGSQGYVYYLADGNGEYEGSAQIGFFNPVSFSTAVVEVGITLIRGSFPFSGTVIGDQTQQFSSADGFQTFTLTAGGSWNSTSAEDVWVWVTYKHISGPTPPNLNLIGISSNLRINSAPPVYNNATVNMALQWPADLKSIDIINGLIQQFNLVVYPHPTQSKTVVFEQFDDWIRNGESKDWTQKWDTATRISINHTVDEEPQELILGNQEDSDRFSVEAKESDPFFQYGTLRILADNNISQGSKSVKNIFAPTVLGGPFVSGSVTQEGNPTYNIDLGSSFAFPHLYKFENNQLKSYKFRTRIGFKSNNTFPSGSDIYRLALGTSFSDSVLISGSYGTLSNVNGLPAVPNAPDLHFNNTYFKFAGPGLNLGNTTSNFDTYWKTYIDSLYWEGNRKVTLDIEFNSQEFKDIKLNDIIFVKDQKYRINKIEGFNLTNDDVATVELIRLYPQYYQNNPNCDFQFSVQALNCDFTFEAIDIGGVTPTPTPAPTLPVCKKHTIQCVSSNGCTGLQYVDCSGNNQSTGFQPFNTTIYACAFTTSNVPGDGYIVSAATDPECQSPTPTPSPTPTLPPGPTPTPSPTPGGQTPTPTPSPTPAVFSYTGTVGYGNYQAACSGSEVTLYTRGEIGTGSIVYEDASLTNVFDFNRFFVDGETGIGYEFVDPNTTGQVISTLDDACNVEIFRLFIDFNEYDACAETVVNTVYAAPGSTIQNGTILYEDINLDYTWYGQTSTEIKFIESGSVSRQIYYNTATGVSASGTDVCFSVNAFSASDFTATTPPTIYCGDFEKILYTEDNPQIGSIIYTDDDLTDPIFTGNNWVYNSSLDILYHMSGSTGGNGTGWVIGEITSSYCTPTTPTPSPTPAPIVTQLAVSASWGSYYDACTNPGFTGTLYLTSLWENGQYVDYFYEDNTQTNIFDFYQYVVDTATGDGYQLPDPNTTGRVISTGSDVCNPGIFSLAIDFNEYEACTGCVRTTKYAQESTFATGIDLYTDIELEYDWTEGIGTDFTITGSNTIYRYTGAERFGGSGVIDTGNTCYSVYEFQGNDYTGTGNPPPPTVYCSSSTEQAWYTKDRPVVGTTIYEDSCLTDTIFTGNKYVYNDTDNELYLLDGTDIAEITGSYCTPPTPTPSPTPAPIVTALGGSTGSGDDNDGFAPICDDDPYGSLVTSSAWLEATWNSAGGDYDYYIYKDSGLTQLWTQVSWIVDGNNDGYYMGRENLGGLVQQFYYDVCATTSSAITTYVEFQDGFDAFCSGSAGSYYNKTLYITESRSYLQDYDYVFENASGTTLYDDQYRTIRETQNGNVWVVADAYNQPATGSRETGQIFPRDPQCSVPVTPLPTITPVPTPTPTPAPNNRWMILEGELCTQTSSTQYYNWYGDPNYFPAALVYDANTGWCMDMYYVTDGYNSNYPEMNCSTRYEYYNTCSDCQTAANEVTCTGPTPPPSGTPTPTPSPTPNPSIKVYEARECYTTSVFNIWYNGTAPTNFYGSGSQCYEIVQEISNIYYDPNDPTPQTFYTSCGSCYSS